MAYINTECKLWKNLACARTNSWTFKLKYGQSITVCPTDIGKLFLAKPHTLSDDSYIANSSKKTYAGTKPTAGTVIQWPPPLPNPTAVGFLPKHTNRTYNMPKEHPPPTGRVRPIEDSSLPRTCVDDTKYVIDRVTRGHGNIRTRRKNDSLSM